MVTLEEGDNNLMPCGHLLSSTGLEDYAWNTLTNWKEGDLVLKCPMCPNVVWPYQMVRDITRIASKRCAEFESKIGTFYFKKKLAAHECPGKVGVGRQKQTCKTLLTFPGASGKATCHCGIAICWRCHRPWKGINGCGWANCADGGKEDLQEVLHKSERVTIARVVNAPRLRACPFCFQGCFHTGGCNVVRCLSCKKYFCFICLEKGANNGASDPSHHASNVLNTCPGVAPIQLL